VLCCDLVGSLGGTGELHSLPARRSSDLRGLAVYMVPGRLDSTALPAPRAHHPHVASWLVLDFGTRAPPEGDGGWRVESGGAWREGGRRRGEGGKRGGLA